MNVFVLCTGRCGSMTFARACSHMTNFTAGHETRRHLVDRGTPRVREAASYPPNHVEIDNRLSWLLGTLDREYGKQATYVHLLREREEVAHSFLNRWDSREPNIIFAYAWGPLSYAFREAQALTEGERLEVARHYWHTVNDNIRHFLSDKPHRHTVWLHDARGPFEAFWTGIGAEGDLDAALAEWGVAHNRSPACGGHGAVSAPRQRGAGRAHEGRAGARGAAGSRDDDDAPATVKRAREALDKALASYLDVDLDRLVPRVAASSWSLAGDALRLAVALSGSVAPRHVLELGSGLSTRVLLEATRPLDPPCQISSLDHDPDFAERTRTSLPAELRQRLELQTAPVVLRAFGESHLPCYHVDPSRLASRDPVDLCIIDGPPIGLGGREGTLYQVLEHCRPGTIVLVDDATRPQEREMLARWSTALAGAVEIIQLPGFERGLAAVVVHQPLRATSLWQHTLSATASEIAAAIPADAKVLLVDDYQWPDELGRQAALRLERDPGFPPATAADAVASMHKLRENGFDFVVFGWPSFWWFEHYEGLRAALDECGRGVLRTGRAAAWDLRPGRAEPGRTLAR